MEDIYIGYKEKNKFIKKKSNFGVTSINQLIHSNPLNEIHKEKDYYSDFDNFEMKKFVYNKLEIINKEVNFRVKKKIKNGNLHFKQSLSHCPDSSQENIQRNSKKHDTLKTTQEFSKKSQINSIFHYDWAKDPNKYDVPYYFMSTPLMRLNENNIPVHTNPLDETKTMTIGEFSIVGNFSKILNI